VILAEILEVPDRSQAILLDLDGTMFDTLTLEFGLVNEILEAETEGAKNLSKDEIRAGFPFAIPLSWAMWLESAGISGYADDLIDRLTGLLEDGRLSGHPDLLPGIRELVTDASERGLKVAVVSNCTDSQVSGLLDQAGLTPLVSLVIAGDHGIAAKPAPDMYLSASEKLGIEPGNCLVLEDAMIGVEAASEAGCHVIGVATGAAGFDDLDASPFTDVTFSEFRRPRVSFGGTDVSSKTINTPNDFVGHMVEHIAWRMGCSIELDWYSSDWGLLGRTLGLEIHDVASIPDQAETSVIGLLDDGSARVSVQKTTDACFSIESPTVDVDWFVGLPCERLRSGEPLVELLSGVTAGAGLDLAIEVISVEDAHHTWEAAFRGFGTALRDISPSLVARSNEAAAGQATDPPENDFGIFVKEAAPDHVLVERRTSESVVEIELNVGKNRGFESDIEAGSQGGVTGLEELLKMMFDQAGIGARIFMKSPRLFSSHVVAEDIGLTLGVGLAEIARHRLEEFGIEGAGSSIGSGPDAPIDVAVSMEGRKFLQIVPIGWSKEELRSFVLGQPMKNCAISEDLDDFLDGLSGGMRASIMVHWGKTADLDAAWEQVFSGLGSAIALLLSRNSPRRGLIPGVKATLV